MKQNHTLITIKNISPEIIVAETGSTEDSPAEVWAEIQPGQVVTLPAFVAQYAIKRILDATLNARDMATNHPTERPRLEKEVVIEIADYGLKQKSEMEVLKEESQRRTADLSDRLNRLKKSNEKTEIKTQPQVVDDEDDFEDEIEEVEQKETSKVTRETLYSYAEKTLKMKLDQKQIKEFDKMSIAELKEALSYEE